MMEIKKYLKKPFEVMAVQVTPENIYEVAKWCQGDLVSTGDVKYIKVRVIHAVNERQTQAYVGDWVLYAGTSYRVYTDKAFIKGFLPVEDPNEQLQLTPTYVEAESIPVPGSAEDWQRGAYQDVVGPGGLSVESSRRSAPAADVCLPKV